MNKSKLLSICKNPFFILTLILAAFFLKGVLMATLFPIFDGQDEARHYDTIQFLAEGQKKKCSADQTTSAKKKGDFTTYNFTEEVAQTSNAVKDGAGSSGTSTFTDGYVGKNEALINSKIWSRYNGSCAPGLAGEGFQAYHFLGSLIEKALSSQSILVRFFTIRIFSVFLGTLTVLLSYLILINAGFSPKNSLLITAMVAFQPRFSIYYSNINYDALLMLSFALFTLGGVLSLKNGINWKNSLIMSSAVAIGLATKGTGIILLVVAVVLFAILIFRKIKNEKLDKKQYILGALIFALVIFLIGIFLNNYNTSTINPIKSGASISEMMASIPRYLSKSLTLGRIGLSSRTYWGNLSWKDNFLSQNLTDIIWGIEGISIIGLVIYFISKKKFEYLPEKKYIIFFIAMIAALQLGIRLVDWMGFQTANSLASTDLTIGTPGRYFLPNLTIHIALVFVGLGALFKKKEHFETILTVGFILMVMFSLYIIFDLIIPQYYL